MKKENLLKLALIFGGGYVLFMLLKPTISKKSFAEKPKSLPPETPKPKEEPKPKFTEKDYEDAEIVANAYTEALKAGEPQEMLTELNKELMKEFNMRCYIDKDNKLVVCDSKGNTVITK